MFDLERSAGASVMGEAGGDGAVEIGRCGEPSGGAEPSGRQGPPGADEVADWRAALAGISTDVVDSERVALIAVLEQLKSAAAGAQARLTAAMADEQVGGAGDAEARARAVRSVAGQVALARRGSPARGHTWVGLARMLCSDLPGTLAALTDGRISEWQATLVGRETVVLAAGDRRQVDAALAPHLGTLGDRRVAQEARRLADRVDPGAVARRVRRAEADRRVTVRPAPGPVGCAMAQLTATMPVAQAVAAFAGLRTHADRLRSQGDTRGTGQIMSDELFARLTGSATGTPDVEVGLVMSERTLLRGGPDPAVLTDHAGRGFAHVPAMLGRRLVRDADRAWLSRLYASPTSGELVAMDSARRTFTGRLRRLVLWRDQTCRMPWCEAPIRHVDHVRAHAAGGRTELANASGLCESCNYVKQTPGWRTEISRLPGHVIDIFTPTGHRYVSRPPAAPGHQRRTLYEDLELCADDWDDGIGHVGGAA